MRGIESDVVAEPELRGERVLLVARNALPYAAVGIDRRGDTVVGVAQNPAAVFDRPHAGHVQVLPRSAGVAIPSVVADVDQHFSAELREVAHLVGEDGFVADEDAVAMALVVRVDQAKYFSIFAAIEF